MRLRQGDYLNVKGVDRETVAKVLLAFQHNGCIVSHVCGNAVSGTIYSFHDNFLDNFLDYVVQHGWLGWDISGINAHQDEGQFERCPSRRRLELADLDIDDPRDRTVSGVPVGEESSGGDVNYYLCKITHPKRLEPCEVECEDIIRHLNMTFDEGEAFKAVWRNAALRLGGGKLGDTAKRNGQKVKHYGGGMEIYAEIFGIENKDNE